MSSQRFRIQKKVNFTIQLFYRPNLTSVFKITKSSGPIDNLIGYGAAGPRSSCSCPLTTASEDEKEALVQPETPIFFGKSTILGIFLAVLLYIDQNIH